ncbi:MAG: GDSL-type esterase/lipase family protein, partial [Bdellovibrionia bacterium]
MIRLLRKTTLYFVLTLIYAELILAAAGSLYSLSFPTLKPPEGDKFRILCLGDSVTFGQRISKEEQTYPSVLEKLLNERAGVGVQVINASSPGASTDMMIDALPRLMEKYKPRIVTFMAGRPDAFQEQTALAELGSHFRIYRLGRLVVNVVSLDFASRRLRREQDRVQKAIAAGKPDPQIYFQLGLIHVRAGNMEEARATYRTFVESSGHSAESFFQVGRACMIEEVGSAQFLSLANEFVEEGMRRWPNDVLLRWAAVWMRAHRGDPSVEALALETAASFPKLAFPYYWLGKFYEDKGRWGLAADHYLRASELFDPSQFQTADPVRIWRELVHAEINEGRWEGADRHLDFALKNLPPKYFEPFVPIVKARHLIPDGELASPGDFYRVPGQNTEANLKRLVQLIKKHGAEPVAIQYPGYSARPLIELFSQSKEVLVLDSEAAIKAALEKWPFDDIFLDRMGDTYGHT